MCLVNLQEFLSLRICICIKFDNLQNWCFIIKALILVFSFYKIPVIIFQNQLQITKTSPLFTFTLITFYPLS